MENENLKLVCCKEVLNLPLAIPVYQRPYKWKTDSALLLFNDIYSSYKEKKSEYRIGSIILYKNEDKSEIVDGQQRLTTLAILLYCVKEIGKANNKEIDVPNSSLLTERMFNKLSQNAIIENYKILKTRCEDIKGELDSFSTFLLEKCTFVQIIVESQQEAFQFFDCQASRGKPLAPHDLLKAYHLREISDENIETKRTLIEEWEKIDQKELASFFYYNLYPLVRWYKNKSGLYYSEEKINTFKGIKRSNKFNHAIYHIKNSKNKKFQLTQPIIAGTHFFKYVSHYFKLCKKIREKLENKNKYAFINRSGAGFYYIKNLFTNVALFFQDRFNEESLTDGKLDILCKWAYSLRLVMQSVKIETVDNYAVSGHSRINKGLKYFERIAEMQEPSELDTIVLEDISTEMLDEYNTKKYEDIRKELF